MQHFCKNHLPPAFMFSVYFPKFNSKGPALCKASKALDTE